MRDAAILPFLVLFALPNPGDALKNNVNIFYEEKLRRRSHH